MSLKFPRLPWYQWVIFLCSSTIILSLLNGCTQEQVDRAEVAANQANEWLDKIEIAEKKAADAVEIADNLATELGSEKAKEAVEKAKEAMKVIDVAHAEALSAVKATHTALDIAKSSQAAGEGTFDMFLDILKGLIPGAGIAVVAIKAAMKSSKSLRQTIQGVDNIRANIGEVDWAAKAAPALRDAQDESVKNHIAKIQAVL